MWRGLSILLVRPRSPEGSNPSQDTSEGWLMAMVVAVAILACIGIGLFPQVLAPLAARLAEAYTFFAP